MARPILVREHEPKRVHKYFCHPFKPQLICFQLDLIQAFLSLPTADQLSQETVNNIIAQVSDLHQSQLPSQVLILNQRKARKMH